MKIAVIGSGYSGLSAAAFLAKAGNDVTIFEKNSEIGGRSRIFKESGYKFDMGPSWYWMCDVFENFFQKLDKNLSDYYEVVKLDPGFKMVFKNDEMTIPSSFDEICNLFESKEKGASKNLKKFMKEASHKYHISMDSLIYNPGLSFLEFMKKEVIQNVFRLDLLTNYRNHVKKYFSNPELISLLEFPVLFLGASPEKTPALYSMIAYSGIKKGTYYPKGGFGQVINGFRKVCEDLGVCIELDSEVQKIEVVNSRAKNIVTKKGKFEFDIIVSSADYSHTENKLLPKRYANYNMNYWQKKTFSPSCLIFYLGVGCKLENLNHHNLFFDEDIDIHLDEIYNQKKWPNKPLFYTCCPSKTDSTVAPEGKENLFILVPVATGIKDTDIIREKYFEDIITKLEKYTGSSIKQNIEYKRSYCINDFINDYNSYEGNAYGLASTLKQTANLRPKIVNKKIDNLYYTGQLTVPGPGVPPSIISGEIVAKYIIKDIVS